MKNYPNLSYQGATVMSNPKHKTHITLEEAKKTKGKSNLSKLLAEQQKEKKKKVQK